jgi:PAS domain S-box-containing protein
MLMGSDDQKRLLEMAGRLAGIGHWRFEVPSGRITWSEETYRIHGLLQTASEPDYARLLGLYSPESADLLARLVYRAIATGQGYELEATIRRPDGAIRFVAAKAECVLGADGKVEVLIRVFQDITEHTQAERFTRAVTDHVPAMVAYWDSNLRCRYANEQYREWFGRSPADTLGISMQELMGQELFERNAPFIPGAISGQRQTFERTLTKPSGEMGHTLARYIPDVDEMVRVTGIVVLVTDVTELKETELRPSQMPALRAGPHD